MKNSETTAVEELVSENMCNLVFPCKHENLELTVMVCKQSIDTPKHEVCMRGRKQVSMNVDDLQ